MSRIAAYPAADDHRGDASVLLRAADNHVVRALRRTTRRASLSERDGMEPLIHLIYTSAAVSQTHPVDMAELLRVSRRNNERAGITGMLLHTDGTFFQVLEGPAQAVETTLAIIARDPRHTGIVTIIRERIARRSFPSWSMGHVTAMPSEIAAAAGMNDFFGPGSCFDALDGGRAKKLLTAFQNGRWRATRPDVRSDITARRVG